MAASPEIPEQTVAQADDFFGPGGGGLGDTLRALARRLDDAGILYAVMGSLAAGAHGYRRLTLPPAPAARPASRTPPRP